MQIMLKHTRQTKVSKKAETITPIINKSELDSVQPDDPRHFQKVTFTDGFESNAISYNPRLK